MPSTLHATGAIQVGFSIVENGTLTYGDSEAKVGYGTLQSIRDRRDPVGYDEQSLWPESAITVSRATVTRRGVLTLAGTAAVAGAATPVRAQEIPDFGPYLDDARLYDGDVTDVRGEAELTIEVGDGPEGLAYGPPTVWLDPGTTVTWVWTGRGGGHNIVPNEDTPAGFLSEEIVADEGFTYEYTFTEDDVGITNYHCTPHEALGMKGGIAVGDDVPTIDPSPAGPDIVIPDAAFALVVAALVAMGAALGLGYVFMKFGGDS